MTDLELCYWIHELQGLKVVLIRCNLHRKHQIIPSSLRGPDVYSAHVSEPQRRSVLSGVVVDIPRFLLMPQRQHWWKALHVISTRYDERLSWEYILLPRLEQLCPLPPG